MKSKQIGRHLKRLAGVGVTAAPVLVSLLEKRYPKYGPLGRQALEMIEALREEGTHNAGSLPTGGDYYPASPLTRESHYLEQRIDSAVQKDALDELLREYREKEQSSQAEATTGGVLGTSRWHAEKRQGN